MEEEEGERWEGKIVRKCVHGRYSYIRTRYLSPGRKTKGRDMDDDKAPGLYKRAK